METAMGKGKDLVINAQGWVRPARWQGSHGPFKSLEIDFSIKGLLSSLIQPMGFFLFVRRSFPLLRVPLKSICEQHFNVGAPSNSILRMGSCVFAAVQKIVM